MPFPEADVRGETPGVGRVQPVHRIDGDLGDSFRLLSRHRLDGRPAGIGADQGDARCGAVEPEGEVVLARGLAHGFHVHPSHVLAFAAGLGRDQLRSEHRACGLPDVGLGGHHLHAPGKAAVAGEDLGLDHPARPADPAGGQLRLLRGERTLTGRRGQPVGAQELLGLVLVDVHSWYGGETAAIFGGYDMPSARCGQSAGSSRSSSCRKNRPAGSIIERFGGARIVPEPQMLDNHRAFFARSVAARR